MFIKLKIHSLVDVITNSSTTIFTNSGNCIEPAKEMITEFFKAFGIEKNVDDVFAFGVYLDEYKYTEDGCECEDECTCGAQEFMSLKWEDRSKAFQKLFEDVATGKVEKPEFMVDAERNSDYDVESSLYIFPKDEKYNVLAEKITKFLYSTSHEVSYN